METLSALLAICAGNSLVTGEFPKQRPAARSFDVFFDLRLNKRLSKQSWGWWFETPSRSLWHHCNEYVSICDIKYQRKVTGVIPCEISPRTQFQYKYNLCRIPIIKMRLLSDRPIFTMGFAIRGQDGVFILSPPPNPSMSPRLIVWLIV